MERLKRSCAELLQYSRTATAAELEPPSGHASRGVCRLYSALAAVPFACAADNSQFTWISESPGSGPVDTSGKSARAFSFYSS